MTQKNEKRKIKRRDWQRIREDNDAVRKGHRILMMTNEK